MSSGLPAALKSADIARFAQRAGQLEKAKPAIAYWCESPLSFSEVKKSEAHVGNYWIVKQLISRGLHNADEDYTRYTTELMDKLEKVHNWSFS